MSRKTAVDLFAEEIFDSPIRRVARQAVKYRELYRKLRKDRHRWLYESPKPKEAQK